MTTNKAIEHLRDQAARVQRYREGKERHPYLESPNVHLVLNYIREHGPISRALLSTHLQLSRSVTSDIVNFLKEKKDLLEEGNIQSSTIKGGKPAIEIKLKAHAGYVIGVDIGRSHLTILLRNLQVQDKNGQLPWMSLGVHLREDSWSRSEAFDTKRGAEVCLPEIAEKINDIVKVNGLEWDDILGIGIGIPGTLDKGRERLTRATMMTGWNDINVPRMLRYFLSISTTTPLPIHMDNDCNYGALGEYRYGAGRKKPKTTVLYLKIGSGVGAGLIINGSLYRGSGGSAGEFGHQSINDGNQDETVPFCETCQTKNCLESYISEPALVKAADLPITGSIEQVHTKVLAGNNQAQQAIHKAGTITGQALRDFINVFDPDLILLDGSVVRAVGDLFMRPLKKETDRCIPAAQGNAEIMRAELGSNAIACGAIASVLDEAFPE